MKEDKLTWKDVVRNALLELDGEGHLKEINKIVKADPRVKTKMENNRTWRATIRRVVRQYKIFEPMGKGVYKLLEELPIKTKEQEFTAKPDIDHGIAQGMLITLGKLYGYETYAPPHDQTIRDFQGKHLGDFVTVSDCKYIFNGPNLPKIREIDVLWFDEDDHGLFPVFAFEIEHTTGVKNGLDRLLKIPQRYREMKRFKSYIIAPTEKEKDLFERYINQTPFRTYKDEFFFRYYTDLEELYNSALTHNDRREEFGVIERGR
ncbi:MAG: hypothetical protein AMJ90_04735 [candidate division Zixibacteria bacterium SM23_73_2]|nr:MAG: hypothetical protein AMJ90_04735 [candidate division Zixibacteria bacterium SM23_73_2]